MDDDDFKRWRSDIDLKLDALVEFMHGAIERERTLNTTVVDLKKTVGELTAVLEAGKGGLWLFFTISKVMASLGVIAAAVYGFKKWVIG